MNDLANKFVAVLLAIALQLPHTSVALAQSSPDIRSPTIQLQVVAESRAEEKQVFTAQVSEDRVLKDVLLYYRRAGQQPYIPVAMTQVGSTNDYNASIITNPTDLRAIEYYIQARDESGNRSVEGYAFDPYTRILIANDTIISTPPEPVSTAETNNGLSKIRWWHIVAGVVVVGAAASLVSNGGDENASTGDGTVPLTVNITGP